MSTATKYTYAQFAQDVIKLCNGEIELTPELSEKMNAKAADLLSSQTKKAEYSATHKKPAESRISDETKARIAAIREVLTSEPMTAAEISAALGVELTALQVANAVKYIPNAVSSKVVRDTVNTKGLRQQKEYTAYAIG